MDEQGREAFREYVVGRSPALLRTAYLLTGDAHLAEDLVSPDGLQDVRHRLTSLSSKFSGTTLSISSAHP